MNNNQIRTTVIKSRGKMMNGEANPIDIYVENRLRLRQEMLKISQMELASLLSITFQQVQKYEKGTNRMGASRIWDMASVLKVPINYFYEGIDDKIAKYSPRRLYGVNDGYVSVDTETDPLLKKAI